MFWTMLKATATKVNRKPQLHGAIRTGIRAKMRKNAKNRE